MTTTRTNTVRDVIDQSQPPVIDALGQIKTGTMLSKIKVTFASLTSAAAIDVTTAASLAAATINSGIVLKPGETLPPIGTVVALRVTAGTAAAGPRVVVDSGGTAGAPGANGPGIAKLSDDGKTLTFEAALTGFVLIYYPAPFGGADQAFPVAAP